MPTRKSGQARTETATMATAGTPAGFTYIGFPKGTADVDKSLVEWISEVALVSGETAAKTVRIVQYNSAGTIKNDITTASFTPVIGAAVDGTLATNVVNAGVNFPWTLAGGDSVLITAVSAGSITAIFTISVKGT